MTQSARLTATLIGVAMVFLAVMSISMGHSMRRSARDAESKINTMEGKP